MKGMARVAALVLVLAACGGSTSSESTTTTSLADDTTTTSRSDTTTTTAATSTTTATTTTTQATTTTTEAAGPYDAFLSSFEGGFYIDSIREAEALVVGRVFTEEMSDTALVDFGIAVCFLDDNLGLFDALAQIESSLEDLGWVSPADGSMANQILGTGFLSVCEIAGGGSDQDPAATIGRVVVPYSEGSTPTEDVAALVDAYLATTEGRVFIDTVRDQEATVQGDVFSESMSDAELVLLMHGVCQRETEVGFLDALTEAKVDLAAQGWDSPADESLLNQMYGSASITVCGTVGG